MAQYELAFNDTVVCNPTLLDGGDAFATAMLITTGLVSAIAFAASYKIPGWIDGKPPCARAGANA